MLFEQSNLSYVVGGGAGRNINADVRQVKVGTVH